MKKFTLTLFVTLLAGIQMVSAQNIRVTGTVSDESGAPLAGVTVLVSGSQRGTTTSGDGSYSIQAPASASLQFSFVGMIPVEVPVSNRNVINVTMQIDAETLEDVVVVAYGTAKREALTGSVSVLDGTKIAQQQVSSLSQALEGTVSGVQLVTTSGQPGEDADIYIRGIGTLYANKTALIVVDGAPFTGKLSELNPNDIESMTISKDATSNSLYGARAANGIVFVTTKKGRSTAPRITWKSVVGVNSRAVPEYDIITNPGEYYEMTWKGLRNTEWGLNGNDLAAAGQHATKELLKTVGNYNSYRVTGDLVDPVSGKLNPGAQLLYNDTFADAIFNNGIRQEHSFSFSGGSDKTSYYTSLGYLNDESYVVSSGFERYNIRTNIESQLKRWLKVGTNLGYSRSVGQRVNESTNAASNAFGVARSWAPIYPVYARDENGNIKIDEKGNRLFDWGTPGETTGTTGRPSGQNQNAIASLLNDFRKHTYSTMTGQFYGEVDILKDFKFRSELSYYNRYYHGKVFYSPLGGDGKNFNGRLSSENTTMTSLNFNQLLNYNKTFDLHTISVLAGHEIYLWEQNYEGAQKTNFYDPNSPHFTNGGDMQYINGYDLEHNTEAYFGKLDYNYANKYYFSGSIRREGTSRFKNNPWGTFWAVGASWRIAEEDFMASSRSWVNELKVRASYGTQGNEGIIEGGYQNYYPYTDRYNTQYDGSNFSTPIAYYGNPNLTWEKQNMLDVGIDFRFFHRLTGSLEYYHRYTDDMLFRRNLAISSGKSYIYENVGAMVNQGFEFEINYLIFDKKDFNWSVSLLGGFNTNKMTRMPEQYAGKDPFNDGMTSGNQKRIEGKNVYSWFMPIYVGVDPNTGKSLWNKRVEETDADGNKSYKIETTDDYNSATKFLLDKSPLPKWTGGFNTNLYYKGFDLSIITSYSLGGYALDNEYRSLMSVSMTSSHHKDMWNSWDPANPDSGTNIPIFNTKNSSTTESSTRFLTNASYFNIRNITLGYTFPTAWMNKLGIESIRLYLTADNVALFSARKGFDPRQSLGGWTDDAVYSPIRTTSVGINVNF